MPCGTRNWTFVFVPKTRRNPNKTPIEAGKVGEVGLGEWSVEDKLDRVCVIWDPCCCWALCRVPVYGGKSCVLNGCIESVSTKRSASYWGTSVMAIQKDLEESHELLSPKCIALWSPTSIHVQNMGSSIPGKSWGFPRSEKWLKEEGADRNWHCPVSNNVALAF